MSSIEQKGSQNWDYFQRLFKMDFQEIFGSIGLLFFVQNQYQSFNWLKSRRNIKLRYIHMYFLSSSDKENVFFIQKPNRVKGFVLRCITALHKGRKTAIKEEVNGTTYFSILHIFKQNKHVWPTRRWLQIKVSKFQKQIFLFLFEP